MSRKTGFELNLAGLNELMKSDGMEACLMEAGRAVAAAAGDGYEASVHKASFVSIANVYPATKEAAKKNRKENALLKGLGSAGLSMSK